MEAAVETGIDLSQRTEELMFRKVSNVPDIVVGNIQTADKGMETAFYKDLKLSVFTKNTEVFGIGKYLCFSNFICLFQDSIIDQEGYYL